MGFLNTYSLACGFESAFHNGTCYECPKCDNEWGCIEEGDDEDS